MSMAIPSRWAYEANLLHEAEAREWGGPQPLPDFTCRIQPENMDLSDRVVDRQHPEKSVTQLDVAPSLNVLGDAAEGSIPRYVLTFQDGAGIPHTCRASEDEGYPRLRPVFRPVPYRHRFQDCLAILAAMLIGVVGSVIAILRKRDRDPQ
jgi:hypothetical protein